MTSKAKKIQEKLKKQLVESSLSRVWSKTQDHDCALISAFRTAKNGKYEPIGKNRMTKDENKARSAKMLKELQALGFEVTKVRGQYEEIIDGVRYKSAEDSYFVVNAKDNPKFVKQIENLGIRYEQDSVCIIQDKGKNAYLIGTNNFADWPGKGKIGKLGKASYGEVVGVYFTRVNGRTFEFVQVESLEKVESYTPQNTLGLLARSIARKQLEKELE